MARALSANTLQTQETKAGVAAPLLDRCQQSLADPAAFGVFRDREDAEMAVTFLGEVVGRSFRVRHADDCAVVFGHPQQGARRISAEETVQRALLARVQRFGRTEVSTQT